VAWSILIVGLVDPLARTSDLVDDRRWPILASMVRFRQPIMRTPGWTKWSPRRTVQAVPGSWW